MDSGTATSTTGIIGKRNKPMVMKTAAPTMKVEARLGSLRLVFKPCETDGVGAGQNLRNGLADDELFFIHPLAAINDLTKNHGLRRATKGRSTNFQKGHEHIKGAATRAIWPLHRWW